MAEELNRRTFKIRGEVDAMVCVEGWCVYWQRAGGELAKSASQQSRGEQWQRTEKYSGAGAVELLLTTGYYHSYPTHNLNTASAATHLRRSHRVGCTLDTLLIQI